MPNLPILDKWYSLQNRWNEEIYDSIPIDFRSLIPILPNFSMFLSHCCIETLVGILDRSHCDETMATQILLTSLFEGNIEKARIILDRKIVADTDVIDCMSRIQDIRLLTQYKVIRPDLWDSIRISPISLASICADYDYITKAFSMCDDEETLDLLVLCSSCPRHLLYFLCERITSSWAHRVQLYDTILSEALEYRARLHILEILVERQCLVSLEEVAKIMKVYPPSIQREKIFYKCLGILGVTEYDFLCNNMKDSKRFTNFRSLFIDKDIGPYDGSVANDSTLGANSTSDIPGIFTVITEHANNVRYLLDIREMGRYLNDKTYSHPYTRETLTTLSIAERYLYLVSMDIPMGVITSNDISLPQPNNILSTEELVQSIVEKHDLYLYWKDIINISSVYGISMLMALQRHPNMIRLYNTTIQETVLDIHRDMHSLLKKCI